jgi:hypothetical protein
MYIVNGYHSNRGTTMNKVFGYHEDYEECQKYINVLKDKENRAKKIYNSIINDEPDMSVVKEYLKEYGDFFFVHESDLDYGKRYRGSFIKYDFSVEEINKIGNLS